MNNLENIINKIKADSKLKEEILLKETINKKEVLKKEIESRFEKESEILKNRYETNKALELERIASSMELKFKNVILKAKGEIIKNLLEDLKEELSNVNEEELFVYIDKILKKRPLNDNEILVFPSKYSNMLSKFKNSKVCSNLKNGFLITYEGIEENYSFDSLIKFKYEELEEIIQKYFN